MSIRRIIVEQLLIEDRKSDVFKKYINKGGSSWGAFVKSMGVTEEEAIIGLKGIIHEFSQNDPSGNNKYLDWMVGQWMNSLDRFSIKEITDLVKEFHELRPKLNDKLLKELSNYESTPISYLASEDKIIKAPKDIYSYKSIEALSFVLGVAKTIVTKKEIKKNEVDTIINNEDLLVISPKTHAASCYYGANTKWCTTSRDDYHFTEYNSSGVLIYVILRSKMFKNRVPNVNEKLAIFFPYTENLEDSIYYAEYFNELDQDVHFNTNASILLGGSYWGKIVDYFKRELDEYLFKLNNYVVDNTKKLIDWGILNWEQILDFKTDHIILDLIDKGRIFIEKPNIEYYGGEKIKTYKLKTYFDDYFSQNKIDFFIEQYDD